MKIIMKPRGQGKTAGAIVESAKTGHRILVRDSRQVKNLIETANYIGVKYFPQPISLADVRNGILRGSRETGVIVDNADTILSEMLEIEVKAMTVTGEETAVEAIDKVWVLTKTTTADDIETMVFKDKPDIIQLSDYVFQSEYKTTGEKIYKLMKIQKGKTVKTMGMTYKLEQQKIR